MSSSKINSIYVLYPIHSRFMSVLSSIMATNPSIGLGLGKPGIPTPLRFYSLYIMLLCICVFKQSMFNSNMYIKCFEKASKQIYLSNP